MTGTTLLNLKARANATKDVVAHFVKQECVGMDGRKPKKAKVTTPVMEKRIEEPEKIFGEKSCLEENDKMSGVELFECGSSIGTAGNDTEAGSLGGWLNLHFTKGSPVKVGITCNHVMAYLFGLL